MTHLYNRFPIEFVFSSTICMKTATFYKNKTCFLGFGNSKSEDKKEIGLYVQCWYISLHGYLGNLQH